MTCSAAVHARVWAGPILVAACGAFAAFVTRERWPDVLVDFGRELYAAWRLSEGDVLHRDLAWFNGPFSPVANGLLFRAFGASVRTLVVANAVVAAVAVALWYRLVAARAGRVAATAAGAVFAGVFAFGQYVGISSYSFATPYSHDLVHGFVACTASIALLLATAVDARVRCFVAGALLGVAALTKPEVVVAGVAACATAFFVGVVDRRGAPWFVGGALTTLLAAYALLAAALPADVAARALAGAWPYVFQAGIADSPFYRWSMGTDAPASRAVAALLSFVVVGAVVGAQVALARVVAPAHERRAALLLYGVVAAVGVALPRAPWSAAAAGLPLWCALFAALALASRRRHELVVVVFAGALLAKILLHARVHHYGFVLALPALSCLVAFLVGVVPRALAAAGRSAAPARALALALTTAFVASHLQASAAWAASKRAPVGDGADRFYADARGPFVQAALDALKREARPGETLEVLPEGVMINFLARIPAATPYVVYMPPNVDMWGEREMRAALERAPPDLVLLVHKDTTEYAVPVFGRDFGASLMDFVRRDYELIGRFGGEPFAPGTAFGIDLLRRVNAGSGARP